MIEIERISDDKLSREIWHFQPFIEHGGTVVIIRLTFYASAIRPTTRHKFQRIDLWDRVDQRTYHSNLSRASVPIPDDVRAEAEKRITVTWA
jgi:hypothetical protein